jgi:gliding motility-associated-like protein
LVILTFYPPITVNAGKDNVIVSGTATSLNGTASGGSGVLSYNWEPGEYLASNGTLTPNTLPLNTETIFTLTALDAVSGCSVSDDVTISVDGTLRPIAMNDYDTISLNVPTIVNVTDNDTDVIGLGLDVTIVVDPAHGTAELGEDGFITYTPEENFSGFDTVTYQICDRGTPSKCSTAQLIVTIMPTRPEIEIYNLVTPDGDGKNDYWFIYGIELFPDNDVTIFNRWGSKIKEFTSYNNTDNHWNGTNNKNEFLPDGVYFYILKIKDLQTFTGWVYVRGNGGN